MSLTGKTIGELAISSGITQDALFIIEQSGKTLSIAYSGMSSSNQSVIDITYSELYNKIINSELIPNALYRLTDYRSVNFLNGWKIADNNPPSNPSVDFYPRQIYTGDTEVLLLRTISDSEFSTTVYSEDYPQDIIEFQPYTNKIGVNVFITNGSSLPDLTTVSGFDLQWDGSNVYFNMPTGYPALFGHYFYIYAEFSGDSYTISGTYQPIKPGITICQYPYIDPENMPKISASTDGYKIILLGLDQTYVTNYDINSLQVDTIYEIGDAFGCITRRIDTERNIDVPFDFRARKYRRYEVDLSPVNSSFGVGYFGQGDIFLGQTTTGNYRDYFSFANDGNDCYNIIWNGLGGYENNSNYYAGLCDNNVFLSVFYNNTIEQSGWASDNTLGGGFINNTILGDFRDNTFFGLVTRNKISATFNNNTIGGNFRFNTINNNFGTNKVAANFRKNQVDSAISSTDFLTAIRVYGDYNCTILDSTTGSPKSRLTFIDGFTNLLSVVSITS